MKRIYLFIALLIGMAGSAAAQSTDLQLLSSIKTIDTCKWNTAGAYGKIIQWGFKNIGPTALVQSTDTIVLKRAYTVSGNASVRLSLPTAGVPVGDTVYFRDTVFFTAAPSTNPYHWCDSAWVKRGSSAMTDPSVSNNRVCGDVRFIEQATSVENVITNANGLSIYPNPASGTVNVTYTFNANTQATIAVRDMMGKVVYTQDLGKNTGERNIPINISSLSSGLYFVELNADGNKAVSKFSVQ